MRDYLFEAISSLMRSANIEYIKWDMNRPLTEVYSQRSNDMAIVPSQFDESLISPDFGETSAVWQSESSHRYVLGLYELQDRITKTFPHILLENCSSGGTQLTIQVYRV